jgi:hypothetical protein
LKAFIDSYAPGGSIKAMSKAYWNM